MNKSTEAEPVTYSQSEIISHEALQIGHYRENIESHRRSLSDSTLAAQPYCGLALSGGGIRAASFHLGVVQSLSAHNVLPWIDYISAVSGGALDP